MRDIMLDALLPYSISDEAAYKLVNFFGDLTRSLECIYHVQIQRHHKKVESEFYCSMSDVVKEDPPF
jgi:hypothetical protein